LLEVANEKGVAGYVFKDTAANSTVQYPHRTVKDYINGPVAQETLQSALKGSFDPNLALCAAHLSCLKLFISQESTFDIKSSFLDEVSTVFRIALNISQHYQHTILLLLDKLDRTGSSLAKTCSLRRTTPADISLELGQWVSLHPDINTDYGGNFLSLVVRFGIQEYVKRKVNRGCLVQTTTRPPNMPSISYKSSGEFRYTSIRYNTVHCLLVDAVVNDAWLGSHIIWSQDTELVAILLENGVEPSSIEGMTNRALKSSSSFFSRKSEGEHSWLIAAERVLREYEAVLRSYHRTKFDRLKFDSRYMP
jgi:hypothetical protein